MTDRIELRGLRVLAICGALPEERHRPQPIEIDLTVEADLAVAGRTDDLADTVDYGALARAAANVAEGGRFTLLEHLAQRIADEVTVTDARVTSVTVAVRKLRPPTPVQLATAGVSITRQAPERGAPDDAAVAGDTAPVTAPPSSATENGNGSSTGPAAADEAATRAVARDVAEILAAEGGGLRRRAFLGLGSNLGDRAANLRAALAGLPGVSAVSHVYETEPLGGPPGQGPFLNLVVELDTDLSPRGLLRVAKRLEEAAGRRPGPRNGPRPLDVDVLLVGDLVVDDPDLVVPHPRMRERRFVLRPLADLAPELVPEAWEATATGAVRSLGSL